MYDQLNIFDIIWPKFKIRKPIRLIELFAGIGSQAMALRDLGADFEHYRVVEFDRFAVASYNAIHGTAFETTDIRSIGGADLGIIDTDNFCYIMTYSFPCQDLSVAGRQEGMAKGSGTRSGLLWEVERLLDECEELPQILLMENVPQVHSKANMPDFQKWIAFLDSKGYSNYWQDLNAKDYGVAQNRNRCFMVSLLGEWYYKFPQPKPLKRKFKDYLENEVGEEYYINSKKADELIQKLVAEGTLQGFVGNINPSGNCINAKDYGIQNRRSMGNGIIETKKEILGSIYYKMSERFMRGIYPMARTIKAEQHDLAVVEMKERRLGNIYGFDGGNYAGNVYDKKALSPKIRTYQGGNLQPMTVDEKAKQYRIRKITPLECWRLMGFSDEDYRKAENVNCKSQLYKQAGNSIVKNVLMAILGQLICDQEEYLEGK